MLLLFYMISVSQAGIKISNFSIFSSYFHCTLIDHVLKFIAVRGRQTDLGKHQDLLTVARCHIVKIVKKALI